MAGRWRHHRGYKLGRAYLVGVSLDGEGGADGQHLEEEGQAAAKGIAHLGAQAGGVFGQPGAQRLRRVTAIQHLGVTAGMGAHP